MNTVDIQIQVQKTKGIPVLTRPQMQKIDNLVATLCVELETLGYVRSALYLNGKLWEAR